MPLSLFEQYYIERGEFKNLEFGLHRIKAASDALNINKIAKNTIHIAGTNGKGSTALFIENILRHRGHSTALFTSPHIHNITERIKLNGKEMPLELFDIYTKELIPLFNQFNLSYFEGLTLIAFKYFADVMPDTAIIETGLGGRLDSTNILDDKIPVITSLSIDHVDFLGDDIFKIADEKLAIIKDNPSFFLGRNTEELTAYIYDKMKNKKITAGDYSDEPYLGFEKPYADNLRLAVKVCDSIIMGGLPEKLNLPMCRMERIGQFILDGAHNEQGLTILCDKFKDKNPVAVFSCTKDRDILKLHKILSNACRKVIITEIPDNDRSINIDTLPDTFITAKSPDDAVKLAVELSENTDILVCGSLYLCAYIREILTKGNS